MPITWPFKMAMPLTGLLLAIQGVSEFCKSLDAAISGRWPEGAGQTGLGREAT
jgi:TRAP-type mannitol/chloroaromatic compound transport system permease small subunit